MWHRSFIGLTASYQKVGGTPPRTSHSKGNRPPAIVILVSTNFRLEEAVLFWNLRANAIHVAWLSFSELESNLDAIAKWLDSDYGGRYHWMGAGSDIAFSSSKNDLTLLETLIDKLNEKRLEEYPHWNIMQHNDLVFYNYIRPSIAKEQVVVMKDEARYTFIPKLLRDNISTGIYAITLEWNGLMLPQSNILIHNGISSETIKCYPTFRREKRDAATQKNIIMPRFRIAKDRYLRLQLNTETPIEFNRPSAEQVVETLFTTAGFSRIEPSSTARYHKNFVDCAGSLEKAAYYLAISPYHELLEVLSDNSNKNRLGWILSHPSERRALHHLHLREVLQKPTSAETKKYFDAESDQLPDAALILLEKNLLERGFDLRCSSCSYKSWYPAEHVGQTFECSRCFHSQVYRSNPLWLYKLPEVIFQGFADNMQVPLLALNYLRHMSQHHFEWAPDSNVYWFENDKELHKNVDILCICDGKLYLGEAKSNDEIKEDQFSFYEYVCRRVAVDGIVFATSKPQWKQGTLERIERLKTQFEGEVIVLTEAELYAIASTH